MVAQAFNPGTWEAKNRFISMSSSQLKLHRKTLSQKKEKRQVRKRNP